MVLFNLWSTSSAVFMDKFLFAISYPSACPLDADSSVYACFSGNASAYDNPLNCSDQQYLNSFNITMFQCFKLGLDYVGAAAAATGMFTVSGSIMAFIIWGLLKATGGRSGAKKLGLVKMVVILLLQLFVCLLIGVGESILLFIPDLEDFLTSDVDNMMRLFTLTFILMMSIGTPWPLFIKEEEYSELPGQNGGTNK